MGQTEASYRCHFITLLIFIWKNSNQLSQELFPRENKLLLAPNTLMGYVNNPLGLLCTSGFIRFRGYIILKGRIKKLTTKMVITSGNEEDKGSQEKESKEETILAMLGIIGTILNLIVIIFVYIYTTL
ncbi:protein TUNAR isoform X1 [Anas platyrhynchos]